MATWWSYLVGRYRRWVAWSHHYLLPYRLRLALYFRPVSEHDAVLARVVTLDPWTVVKFGNPRRIVHEVQAISFLTRRTTLPLPRIQAVTAYHGGRVGHFRAGGAAIIMSRLSGKSLDDVWHTLTDEERLGVMRDLRACLRQLEMLTPPAGQAVVGCIGGPVFHHFRDDPFGPFSTVAEFHDFLHHLRATVPSVDEQWQATCREARQQLDDNCPVSFTHGDLQTKNILTNAGKITGIIDWEYAAFMPAWWECAWASANSTYGEQVWAVMIDQHVRSYPKDLAAFGRLHRMMTFWDVGEREVSATALNRLFCA